MSLPVACYPVLVRPVLVLPVQVHQWNRKSMNPVIQAMGLWGSYVLTSYRMLKVAAMLFASVGSPSAPSLPPPWLPKVIGCNARFRSANLVLVSNIPFKFHTPRHCPNSPSYPRWLLAFSSHLIGRRNAAYLFRNRLRDGMLLFFRRIYFP